MLRDREQRSTGAKKPRSTNLITLWNTLQRGPYATATRQPATPRRSTRVSRESAKRGHSPDSNTAIRPRRGDGNATSVARALPLHFSAKSINATIRIGLEPKNLRPASRANRLNNTNRLQIGTALFQQRGAQNLQNTGTTRRLRLRIHRDNLPTARESSLVILSRWRQHATIFLRRFFCRARFTTPRTLNSLRRTATINCRKVSLGC